MEGENVLAHHFEAFVMSNKLLHFTISLTHKNCMKKWHLKHVLSQSVKNKQKLSICYENRPQT